MATRKKIALIGAGNIGGELARLCANKELGDVVLFDIPAKENFAKGKALDLEQNGAILGYDATITRHVELGRSRGRRRPHRHGRHPAQAGPVARRPRRDEPPDHPRRREQREEALPRTRSSIVISNPLDAMVYEYKRVTGCAKEQGRRHGRRARLARASSSSSRARPASSVKDVRAMVLGGHGDDMVPVLSTTHDQRRPRRRSSSRRTSSSAIIERTRKGGGEIVNAHGHERVLRAGVGAVAMAEAYLLDQKRLLAVRRVPRRRVRLQGPLHGRAGRHRRQGRREDRRDPAHRRREGACSRRARRACRASSTS